MDQPTAMLTATPAPPARAVAATTTRAELEQAVLAARDARYVEVAPIASIARGNLLRLFGCPAFLVTSL